MNALDRLPPDVLLLVYGMLHVDDRLALNRALPRRQRLASPADRRLHLLSESLKRPGVRLPRRGATWTFLRANASDATVKDLLRRDRVAGDVGQQADAGDVGQQADAHVELLEDLIVRVQSWTPSAIDSFADGEGFRRFAQRFASAEDAARHLGARFAESERRHKLLEALYSGDGRGHLDVSVLVSIETSAVVGALFAAVLADVHRVGDLFFNLLNYRRFAALRHAMRPGAPELWGACEAVREHLASDRVARLFGDRGGDFFRSYQAACTPTPEAIAALHSAALVEMNEPLLRELLQPL